MNAFDLSLVNVIVGVRGAGKTLLCTHFVLEALKRAWVVKKLREIKGYPVYPKQKTNIWSNYHVKAIWHTALQKRPVKLESQLFDLDKLLLWAPEFHDGIIHFDEIDQVADRQDWFSVVSKFLTAGVQLIRHRNLTLVLTIQSLEWLNSRLQWQSDIIIKCRDLAFSPWGREKKLAQGEVISTTFIDKSGVMTGYSFEETNKVYPMQFYGRRYWKAYLTQHEVDVVEQKTKRRVKVSERIIDTTGQQEDTDRNQDAINAAILYYKYSNTTIVPTFDFWGRATAAGFEGNPSQYARYIASLGVSKKGNNFTFEGVTVNV